MEMLAAVMPCRTIVSVTTGTDPDVEPPYGGLPMTNTVQLSLTRTTTVIVAGLFLALIVLLAPAAASNGDPGPFKNTADSVFANDIA